MVPKNRWLHKSRAYDESGPAGSTSETLGDGENKDLYNEEALTSRHSHQRKHSASRYNSEPGEDIRRGFSSRRLSEPQRSGSNAKSLFPGARSQNVLQLVQMGGPASDSLGLHLVRDVSDPDGDIIFVHGLGGNAYKTWCWNRDEANFWPAWLAEEEGLESYRIFTFGYNSDFKGAGTNLNVIDFAKGLLTQMLTSSGYRGRQSTPIGKQSIIFVAHSLGGLVVKKAYILGRSDDNFAEIVSKVHGIIFLATPHRGASYAKILNNILSSAPLGAPPKAYIADLDTHSSALQDINEHFRSVCGELALVSFFETLKTSFGIHKVHVVEKLSGVLGYTQEISDGLNADHHTICKYRDREDGNYISVKNMIKLLAKNISPNRPILRGKNRRMSSVDTIKKIQAISGIRERADDELKVNLKRILDCTCSWLTRTREFEGWVEGSRNALRPTVFHLIGLPAAGKTTITSHVIDHLQSLDEVCQYHFFSTSHQNKRTVAYCLRSIVSQLAISNETFRKRLFHLHEETGIFFSSQDQNFSVIWDKIFEGLIFKMDFQMPLCWILDGVDEADTPLVLINSLMKMETLSPIRIFLSSRPMKLPISQVRGPMVTTLPINERHTANDIRLYVQSAVRDFLPDDDKIQQNMVDQVLAKAEGSFLWVKLVLDTLQINWHTLDDIRESLTEIPRGMEPMYERMVELINAQPKRQQAMAKTILTWAVCSWRPLSVAELQLALQPDFKGFVKLQETIIQICGHFISIDNGRISLIHATAPQFLLQDRAEAPAFIDEEVGHEHIAIVCLTHLSNDSWKRVFKSVESLNMTATPKSKSNLLLVAEQDHYFLGYSTCYWAYHVSKASLDSERLFHVLDYFLKRYCLSWIEGVALSKNLCYLTRSARFLKVFAKRKIRQSKVNSPLTLTVSPENQARDIQLWATDFIRIVGKFGHNLVQNPSAIHRIVPPFCPSDSMIGRTYGKSQHRPFSVSGLLSKGWDDCLASVSTGDGKDIIQVLATDVFFITLSSGIRGSINIFFADTCALARTMHHEEYIRRAKLNKTRTLLAAAGGETYRVWDIATGEALYHMLNATRALPMAIAFGASDFELVVGLDDCSVTCYDLRDSQKGWRFVPVDSREEIQDSPKIMDFSPDLTKVAMAWRGKPPLVFDLNIGESRSAWCRVLDTSPALCAAERIQWQHDSSSVLVLCESTKLIEWHLYDEEQTIYEDVKAREMTVSRDGDLLLTSDSAGNVSVWTFPRLHLIYRLENESEFIRSISFSPDGQRFYKSTDNKCSVWEPDVLVRPDEQELEDHSSTAGSSLATEPIIIREDGTESRVTSLAYGFADRFYCAGRDDGTVRIHDAIDGAKLCTVSKHDSTSSVVALHWSYSNKYIISGDDAGHLVAKRLQYRGNKSFKIFGVFDIRVYDPIHQLFLNGNEKLLLISTSSTDEVWDLEVKERSCHRDWGERQGRQWIQHPSNGELLLWIEPESVRIYDWRALEETEASIHAVPAESAVESSPEVRGETVVWAALTNNKQYIIYLADSGDPSTRLSSGLYLRFLTTSNFQVRRPSAHSDDCMADLASRIVRLIGTYQDRIVFLDHDYWLCTWGIDADGHDVKRHFFLPKDWLSPSTLEIAALNNQGTFFCPKRGNVAIVRHGMRF